MPAARIGVPAVELGGKMYVIAEQSSPSDRVDIYDAESDRWTPGARLCHIRSYFLKLMQALHRNECRQRHAVASIPGRNLIFTFGGLGNTLAPLDTLEQYDPRQV